MSTPRSALRRLFGSATSARMTFRRSATGAKYRTAVASGGAASSTVSRAWGSDSSHCLPSTLIAKPVPPVTSSVMVISRLMIFACHFRLDQSAGDFFLPAAREDDLIAVGGLEYFRANEVSRG